MNMELRKSFQFEAAHLLPLLPEAHKCRRLHGHSFKVEIVIAGECDPKLGWLMDYADIKAAFKRCLVEGWATGTIDSGSITPQGEKVLEKLNPEIRAFPAPTLRNRLNDALFRNQGNRPAAPAAAAAAPAPDAEDAAEEEDDTVPEAEEEEVEAVDADDPDVEKAA